MSRKPNKPNSAMKAVADEALNNPDLFKSQDVGSGQFDANGEEITIISENNTDPMAAKPGKPRFVSAKPQEAVVTEEEAKIEKKPRVIQPVALPEDHIDDEVPVGVLDTTDIAASIGCDDPDVIEAGYEMYVAAHKENLVRIDHVSVIEVDKIARDAINQYVAQRREQIRLEKIAAEKAANPDVEVEAKPVVIQEAPKVAEIIVDKTEDMTQLGLTDEEHEKIQHVNRVKLIEVTDNELSTIKIIDKTKRNIPTVMASKLASGGSRYGVPCVGNGDFMYFSGAQLQQLITLNLDEEATISEHIMVKTELAYKKWLGGNLINRTKPDGSIPTFEEFANQLRLVDLSSAIYAIVCASSPETNVLEYTCGSEACKHVFPHRYSIRDMYSNSHMTGTYKKRSDAIIDARNDVAKLKELSEEYGKVKRIKSPFSNHIFDVSVPTCARAISVYKKVFTRMNAYIGELAIHLTRILLWDAEEEGYVEILDADSEDLLEVVANLADSDIELLREVLRGEDIDIEEPAFMLNIECPQCGRKVNELVDVSSMVFLRAQDFQVEPKISNQ